MRGDFNNGGYDDLAAGTLGESVGDAEDSGFTSSARGYAIRETAPLVPVPITWPAEDRRASAGPNDHISGLDAF